ncbi:MAG: hypothetical protein A3I11_04145 [Elusimicrobia bacterium RIFCSPLOWO2_02_FULL_39_32]|nr:MAG: hypothetical protein A3B80_02720 [Elusimicrobia bacterium RIFCSPHIGHO2_02_FULL_39_36]OGR92891.1 MAG: hypothetical protein A3I11_04145 [Elusimicrobia bacterium RIFCSPLOWO2_02_FULL_39_32]OGR99675.1 MAG: hypothetical protein A3G85_01510 [Elusimicrobia bacterium RIFCSPLOWO2_12_FULL_39_28]
MNLKKILQGSLILFTFIFFLELWARLFPQWTPVWSEERKARAEFALKHKTRPRHFYPGLGWVMKPKGLIISTTRQEIVPLGEENIGIRDHSISTAPWAVVLGDSFAEGIGVTLDNIWIKQLEKKLNKKIINLGQGGFTSNQYLVMLLKAKPYFKPAFVICCIYKNDFNDRLATQSLDGIKESDLPIWNINSKMRYYGIWLLKNSFIYRLIRAPDILINDKKLKEKEEEVNHCKIEPFYHADKNIHIFLTPFVLNNEVITYNIETPNWKKAVSLVSEDIKLIQQEVKKMDAKLVVLYFPSREQSYTHLLEKKFKISSALDAPNNAIKYICEKYSIPFLDLTKPLRDESKKGKQLYLTFDGHWTREGNRFISEKIAEWVSLIQE